MWTGIVACWGARAHLTHFVEVSRRSWGMYLAVGEANAPDTSELNRRRKRLECIVIGMESYSRKDGESNNDQGIWCTYISLIGVILAAAFDVKLKVHADASKMPSINLGEIGSWKQSITNSNRVRDPRRDDSTAP
jgi:hypothetical protein